MNRLFTMLTAATLLVSAPLLAQEASQLDVSQADGFMGKWTLSFDSPQGPLDYALDLSDVGGKVAATLNNDFLGDANVTDISKSGEALTLKWDASIQGTPMALSMDLTPEGEGLKASLDFGGMAQMDGTGAR